MKQERTPKGAVVYSVALHVAVVAALTAGVHLPGRQPPAPAPIQGVIVDPAVLERHEQAVREEQQRQQREERDKREAEQRVQRERDEAAKREQERVAQEKAAREQKAREEAAKREQERVAKEKAERERVERAAQEKKQREEAAKAAAARKQQQQAEDDLQRQLAAEADRQQAERAGLLDQYIRMIQDKIERNWTRPLSAKPGLDCMVSVVQLPTGDVIDQRVTSCNGDDAVVRSIEAAVKLASPLPRPPNPNLFERNLNVRFRPDL
jgi:colicin import membrane protein